MPWVVDHPGWERANLPSAARLVAAEALRAGLEALLSRPEPAAALAARMNLPPAARRPKTLYNLVQGAITLELLRPGTASWSLLVRGEAERGMLLDVSALTFEKWETAAEVEAALETCLRDLFEEPGLADMLASEH